MNRTASEALLQRNSQVIPGGVVSLNRKVEPTIAFVRGKGAHLWDADDNKYLDFHAGFAPYLLGHGDPDVEMAVRNALDEGRTLSGSGTTPWEGEAAELLVECAVRRKGAIYQHWVGSHLFGPAPSNPAAPLGAYLKSEATYLALRLARAHTGRDHIVVMQGGYNGWHDEVACNVMTLLERV